MQRESIFKCFFDAFNTEAFEAVVQAALKDLKQDTTDRLRTCLETQLKQKLSEKITGYGKPPAMMISTSFSHNVRMPTCSPHLMAVITQSGEYREQHAAARRRRVAQQGAL